MIKLMKNKAMKTVLPIVLLGVSAALWIVITHYTELSNGTLQLNEVWIFQADDRIIASPILIDDQIIFRTANRIYSVSAVDGNVNWEVIARASDMTINVNLIGKPIVGNSKFLVSEEQENSIGIYSTKTGEKIWTVDGEVNFINAPIQIVDGLMVVARHDGNLVVYDLASHQKLWEVALPPRSSTPIAANPDLIIVGMKDVLRVYNLKDGSILNEKAYAESLVAEIALSGSNIFVSYAKEGGDWTISSLQLDSLNVNWAFHAGTINHPYLSSTNDYVSFFNETLLVLDTNNGKVLWQGNAQEYYSAPAFHQNNFIFISKEKMLGRSRKICKIEIGKDRVKGCSVDSAVKIFESLQPPGPLAANDLLIIPRNSEIVAFTMP